MIFCISFLKYNHRSVIS